MTSVYIIPMAAKSETPVQDDQRKIFQPERYANGKEVKPREFGGDRFTLETILEGDKLVTFVGVQKDKTGKRDYELVGKLPFEFRSERRPTKPTDDISRLEVTLRPHRSDPNVYGVCQDVRVSTKNPMRKEVSRYIGIVRRSAK